MIDVLQKWEDRWLSPEDGEKPVYVYCNKGCSAEIYAGDKYLDEGGGYVVCEECAREAFEESLQEA